MTPVKLQITSYASGREVKVTWTFTPLRNKRSWLKARQNSTAGSGRLRRRPFNKREVRTLKIPAHLMLDPVQRRNFEFLCDAHKCEWWREIGGKAQWVQFDLDIEESIVPDFVEEIDYLESYEIKLVQSDAVWYPDFQTAKVQFTDYQP